MGRIRCYVLAWIELCLLMIITSSSGQTCGQRKVVNFLIVNGTVAKDGHWPWHVALFLNNGRSFAYACGGTILDQNTVLTAAHCLMTSHGIIALERLVVQVGRNRLRVASEHTQEREAFQLILHPDFNANSIQHDIALIKLASDITYTDYVQPICLWNQGDDQYSIDGSWGTVIGFGIDETDSPSDTLREARIPVVSAITCIESNRETFATLLTSNMFCAGTRDSVGACNGDSGGGLFFNYGDTWFIRGLVSFSKPREDTITCDTKEYTVFTDVAKYLEWIESHMRVQQTVVEENYNNFKIWLLPISTCGVNPFENREETSKPVLLGYPWVGLVECVETEGSEAVALCQATLISDWYLITTANCSRRLLECLRSTVRLGEYDRSTTADCIQFEGYPLCSPGVQTILTDDVFWPSEYDKLSMNDIGLIRLRDRADTSWANVKPICLPLTYELRIQKSTHYISTTWNFDSPSYTTGNVLQRMLRENVDLNVCQKLWPSVTEHHICTKQQYGPDCISAHLGSPLQLVQQVQEESRYVLYGVLFGGPDYCTDPEPDVYTNVAHYIDWILANIEK